MLLRVQRKLWRFLSPSLRYSLLSIPTQRLGSKYGGWIVPAKLLDGDSICYLAGAGLDISFDEALARTYGCKACVLDPTPAAADFVWHRIEAIKAEEPAVAARLNFIAVGIWDTDTELKFYKPKDDTHISHSLVNLQGTSDYIMVPVRTLRTHMQQFGHHRIDLLKLDIEGAEYAVIQNLLENAIDVRCICVEFDEYHSPQDARFLQRIQQTINALVSAGYSVVAVEKNGHLNMTFLKLS